MKNVILTLIILWAPIVLAHDWDDSTEVDDTLDKQSTVQVTCGSHSLGQVYCSTPVQSFDAVELSHQISKLNCKSGISWGHDNHFLWTSRGCRGVFTIWYE